MVRRVAELAPLEISLGEKGRILTATLTFDSLEDEAEGAFDDCEAERRSVWLAERRRNDFVLVALKFEATESLLFAAVFSFEFKFALRLGDKDRLLCDDVVPMPDVLLLAKMSGCKSKPLNERRALGLLIFVLKGLEKSLENPGKPCYSWTTFKGHEPKSNR